MPTLTGWVRTAAIILAAVVAITLAGIAGYRLFFQGQDLAQEQGNRIVAEEQVEAEAAVADGAMAAVREREVYREHVTTVVREGSKEVNDAWTGETVGDDVDAAGSAALCRLHDSLCRPAATEAVQQVR